MKHFNQISNAMQHILRVVIFCCFFLVLSNVSEATHFRYGSISWQKVSGTTYKITVSQVWRKSFFSGVVNGGTVNTGLLNLGDGTTTPVLLEVTTVNAVDDWFYGIFIYTKTYSAVPAVMDYNVTFTGCCRISTLLNAADGGYLSSTKINVGTANNSPIATTDPIRNAQINTINTFSVALNDPDGDILTYQLATPAEMGATNYVLPAGVSINSATGLVTFNGTGKQVGQKYTLGVVVSDGKTSVMVDFIVTIIAQHSPPQFDYSVTPVNAHVFQVPPGQPVIFDVKAYDPEPVTFVVLSGVGLPAGSSLTPVLSGNPASAAFNWIPANNQLGTFVINFTAINNFGVQVSTSVTLVVSLKPIFNVPPTPAYGIELATVAGTPIQFAVEASDPDLLDVVRLTNIINKPATATLTPMPSAAANPTTANFSWNPVIADWGEREIEFEATDSYGDQAYHKIGIIVNTPPVFTSTPPVSNVIVNQSYSYVITGSDPDLPYGDELELVGVGIPGWLTLIDNGNGTGTLTGTSTIADAGTYTITLYLEDIYHHSGVNGVPSQTVTITVIPCTIALDSVVVSNVTCNGSANGRAEVLFTGGFGPFTYQWSNGSTDSILVAGPGTYRVIITDAYNCSITDTARITEPTVLTTAAVTSDYNGFGVSCFGGTNGSAAITAAGGTPGYNIYWSTGSTGSSVTGLPAGNYTAHVIDANGCSDSIVVTITEPAKIVASISGVTNIACFGGSTGSATAAAIGGVAPYTYLWSNGSTAKIATGLSAINYSVIITDWNGCSSTASVLLTQPAKISVSITSPTVIGTYNTSCSLDGDGVATVTGTGGILPYTTIWNTGAASATISGLLAGTYTATLTDKNGCTATSSITLTKPENCNCITASVASAVSCNSCTKVLDGQSNVIINTGDNACVVNAFTGNININGGNLVICGNAALQWLNIPNNSKVTILGTVTLSGINFNGTNAVLENFGTLVINGSLNVSGKLTNNKTITVRQGANFNSGSYVINNGTFNVASDLNNNGYFANNGLLNVENTIYNNSNSTMLNNCTTKSRSYFVNSNVVFANNGTLNVANDIRFNNAACAIASGSIVRTKDAYLNGTTLSGANTACALIHVSSYTQINQAALNGKIALCDANGFEVQNNLTLLSGANTSCTTCNYSGTPGASTLRDGGADELAAVQVDDAITVYPNPASNGAEVTISSSVEVVSTTILDNLGRVVLTASGPVFNVSDLSTGIYLVKIEDVLGDITTVKLVVK